MTSFATATRGSFDGRAIGASFRAEPHTRTPCAAPLGSHQSVRIAVSGSIRVARRAGTTLATTATVMSTTVTLT